MNLALSDVLTCPRCGPTHGLVLLPGELRGRAVVTGVLGCPNCRERFPIADGAADLRVPGMEPPAQPTVSAFEPGDDHGAAARGPDGAVKLGALLGLESAAGLVAVAGPAAAHAAELASLLEGARVVVLAGFGAPEESGSEAVSRVLISGRLPFRDAALAGIALTGGAVALLDEGVRATRPGGRVLLEPASPELRTRASAAGLAVVLHDAGTLVVARGA